MRNFISSLLQVLILLFFVRISAVKLGTLFMRTQLQVSFIKPSCHYPVQCFQYKQQATVFIIVRCIEFIILFLTSTYREKNYVSRKQLVSARRSLELKSY